MITGIKELCAQDLLKYSFIKKNLTYTCCA